MADVGANPTVRRAAQSALERGSLGVASSRFASGTNPEITSAEARLAAFLGTEGALLLPSKNQGIFTLFAALLGERDVVFADELTQAPVSDAAFLVQAEYRTFKNTEPTSLLTELEKARHQSHRLVFCEGLSPVTGLPAELKAVAAQAARFDAHVVVDESFSLSALGVRGAGRIEETAALPPLCIVGDFGHSMGLFGGFLAGPQALLTLLQQRSRALGIDAPLPPALAAATEAAVDFVELAHLSRDELQKRSQRFTDNLRAAGLHLPSPTPTPVVSIPVPRLSKARELEAALFQRGFLAEVVATQVPFSETAYLRLVLNTRQTEKQLESATETIIELVPRVLRN
ncbi:MAG: pyridoxal phosphate-dependent aminotransferase family protein [Proteobacteria bacterium]|nr:pyridoxal phosphate-dependent aminotransferase family protein [Pseudomonadota bacterium]